MGKRSRILIGKPPGAITLKPPLDDLCSRDAIEVLNTGKSLFAERSAMSDTGVVRSFELRAYPDKASDGLIQGVLGMCRDISDYRADERELQRQGDLLQAANDMALLLFSDGGELDDQANHVLGLVGAVSGADVMEVWRNHGSSEEGLLCTKLYSWNRDNAPNYYGPYSNTAVYSANLPGWEAALSSELSIDTASRPLSAAEREHMELQRLGTALAVPILFKHQFWGFMRMGVHGTAHRWGKGEDGIMRSVGLLFTATMQRRHMQAALAESEQRFRDVAMATGEIIWELDAQGYIASVSERVLALTGYAPHEVFGTRWEDFAMDEIGEEATGRMFQLSLVTGSFRAFEHRIRSKGGEPIWLLSSGKLLIGEEGIAGLRGISLGVTNDKKIGEDRKKHAENSGTRQQGTGVVRRTGPRSGPQGGDRQQGQERVSGEHEPLNTHTAQRDYRHGLPDAQDEAFSQAERLFGQNSTARASLFLGQRTISSISPRSNPAQCRWSACLSILKICSPIWRPSEGARADEAGLDVGFSSSTTSRATQWATRCVLAGADQCRGQRRQVYGKGGISVRCALESMEGSGVHLRITVRDIGIGIPEERQSMLFQSFSQVDSFITRKYGDTGLGLVIAKNMVELAGGSLRLESTEGKGTKITIIVPMQVDTETPLTPDPTCTLPGLSVVVVEESDMQRALVLDMLLDMGCDASAYSDMAQGFTALAGADSQGQPVNVFVLSWALANADHSMNLPSSF